MAKSKEQKVEIVKKIKKDLKEQKSLIFVNFRGLSARELFELRRKLKLVHGRLYAAKKNLINIAFKRAKISLAGVELPGEIALAFSAGDGLEIAKILYQSAVKAKKPEILAAFLEKRLVGKDEVIELAKLPSKKEILGRLVAALNFPAYSLANVLEANIKGLIYIIKQKAKAAGGTEKAQ
jgi:large subunit ribosomal protein L10